MAMINRVNSIVSRVDMTPEATITEDARFVHIVFTADYRREFYDYVLMMWAKLNQQCRPVAVTWFGKIRRIKVPVDSFRVCDCGTAMVRGRCPNCD